MWLLSRFVNIKSDNDHILSIYFFPRALEGSIMHPMKRDLYPELLNWKASENRKPLILRGARQVGKTHLLRLFGRQEYSAYIYLNFEEDPKLANFFADALKPTTILQNISLYTNQQIHPENTLLIFDEIQESPAALNSLKYFQEQANQYHIVAAGSLLGVKLAHTKGFPVGKVNFFDLYPLSFFEFLDAIGRDKLRAFLMAINSFESLPEPIHLELLTLLKKYMFIGGMPEAILEYAKSENILAVRKIQKEILDAYMLDFAKHAPKEHLMKITSVWESIPSQLAKENKKFIFSALHKSARGREYEAAIQWLADAGLVYKSYNISAPKLPLSGYANKNFFKLFLLDVGLLAAMSNLPPKLLVEKSQLFLEFNGAFTENYVAQTLTQKHYLLHYWTSEGIAEVDFVMEHDLHIFPLEVKAGTDRKKKSLLEYGKKYAPPYLLRASLMNLKQDSNVCNFPLYLVGQFIHILCKNATPQF